MKRKTVDLVLLYILLLTLLSFFGCDVWNPVSERPEDKAQSSLLKLSFVSIPSEVRKIVAKLSREGFETLTKEISVTGRQAVCRFNEVAAGTWHLKVEAKDETGVTLYTGETDVIVVAGQTTNVHLELKPVGNIEIGVKRRIHLYTILMTAI